MVQPSLTVQQLLQLADVPASVVDGLPADLRRTAVHTVTPDSRNVTPGAAFVAVPGSTHDGHQFLLDAATSGAAVALVETLDPAVPLPQVEVKNTAEIYGRISMTLAVGQANPVQTAGVTGTNGKTTTTWMLRSILQAANRQTGLIGTISHHDGIRQRPSDMTTPDAASLAAAFASMKQQGTTHCAMEISSHALHQNRAAGVKLSAAAVTNVTQDHFDYHGNVQNYLQAKASITKLLHPLAPLLLNIDDPGCRKILNMVGSDVPVVSCGIDNPDAEINASILRETHRSTTMKLNLAQGDCEVRLKLVGRHNVSNALIAAALAEQLGLQMPAIVDGLQSLASVPGRLQRIDRGQPFQVFVDYAHTPDAIRHCLNTVREFTPGRVICVLGAGGDRDRLKRPLMGEAASVADRCVVTSDNPRTEDPHIIISDVVEGITSATELQTLVDRTSAIEFAIETASPGDTVVIAGRGHELFQEQNGERIMFDDVEVAQNALANLVPYRIMDASYARSA